MVSICNMFRMHIILILEIVLQSSTDSIHDKKRAHYTYLIINLTDSFIHIF